MLAFLGYLIADCLVRWLPASVTDRLAVGAARVVFVLRPPARRILEANLASVHPAVPPATHRHTARRAFEHFALSFADFLRLRRLPAQDLPHHVRVRGARHLEAARRAGCGVIVLSAHLGNWEWGAAFLAASGTPLHVLARRDRHPLVERFVEGRRRSRGVRTIERRPAWVPAASLLRNGGWVALMGDRGAAGNQASTCRWAAALARRTGALVLPAVILRSGSGRYTAWFGAPLDPEACARGHHRAAMLRAVRRFPAQWLAFEPVPAGWA